MQQLIELFTKPPASFTWSTSEDGSRTMGTSEGFILDILPGRVEAAALFPPDRPDLAARNGVLLQLLLAALRPDWPNSDAWLAQQMRLCVRSKQQPYEEVNVTRRTTFHWDRARSRAALVVRT